jgi:cystathionine beta-synthase
VSDKDSFLTARRLTSEEGLLAGGSSGSALWGALEVARELGPEHIMVVVLPDGGRNYLSKIYNESWMLEHGFIDRPGTSARIGAVMAEKRKLEGGIPDLVVVPSHEKVGRAIEVLQEYGISQVPVARNDKPEELSDIVGSIQERSLLDKVVRDRDALERDVAEIMDGPLPVVQESAGVEEMFSDLARGAEAIVVADGSKPLGVLTRADLLEFLANQARR